MHVLAHMQIELDTGMQCAHLSYKYKGNIYTTACPGQYVQCVSYSWCNSQHVHKKAARAERTSKRAMEVFTITPAPSSTPPSPSSLILSQQGAGVKSVH